MYSSTFGPSPSTSRLAGDLKTQSVTIYGLYVKFRRRTISKSIVSVTSDWSTIVATTNDYCHALRPGRSEWVGSFLTAHQRYNDVEDDWASPQLSIADVWAHSRLNIWARTLYARIFLKTCTSHRQAQTAYCYGTVGLHCECLDDVLIHFCMFRRFSNFHWLV